MYQSILVPVDGSEYSQKALKVASQLANSDEAVIYLLNVPELPPATDPLGIAVGASSLDISTGEIEAAGERLVEQLKGAEEAGRLGVEAIVMGSRGMSDLKSLAVGSTSHKVMHTANCTVITVH